MNQLSAAKYYLALAKGEVTDELRTQFIECIELIEPVNNVLATLLVTLTQRFINDEIGSEEFLSIFNTEYEGLNLSEHFGDISEYVALIEMLLGETANSDTYHNKCKKTVDYADVHYPDSDSYIKVGIYSAILGFMVSSKTIPEHIEFTTKLVEYLDSVDSDIEVANAVREFVSKIFFIQK